MVVQVSQLEGFLAIVESGRLSRAALDLHLSQPALTARIHALETELGTPLFIRAASGMRLTAAGEALIPFAKRALGELEEARQKIRALEPGEGAQLRLGASPSVGAYLLPCLLSRFAARYPCARISITTGHIPAVIQAIRELKVDIGLIHEVEAPGLEMRPLYADGLVLVGAPTSHLAKEIPRSTLGELRLITFPRDSSYFEPVRVLFREAGVDQDTVIEVDNIETTKGMVASGLGFAFLPFTAVAGELALGKLHVIRVAGGVEISRNIVAVRRAKLGQPVEAVGAFLDILEDVEAWLPHELRQMPFATGS